MAERNDSRMAEVVALVLMALGMLLIVGAAVGAVLVAAAGPWEAAIVAVAGIVGGAMALSLAMVLRSLAQQADAVRESAAAIEALRTSLAQFEAALRGLASSEARAGDAGELVAGPPASEAVLESLEELRGLVLMSEEQRSAVAQQHHSDRREQMIRRIEQHLGVRDWGAAGEALNELAAAFPDEGRVGDYRARLEAGRAAGVSQEVAAARERIRHLMSISAWDQAAEGAAQLQRKYPAAAEPRQMVEEIERERQAFEKEFAQRLFLDLSDATEHRRWRRAVEIAEEILRRHPSDRRADKLRHDLETLRENAAAQERKEQETLFKDLLKRQRYHEAIEVANALIHKYPLSPTAAELINLLPKVHDLLHAERVKRSGGAP